MLRAIAAEELFPQLLVNAVDIIRAGVQAKRISPNSLNDRSFVKTVARQHKILNYVR